MSFAVRLRIVLVPGTRMQDDVVVEELHVTVFEIRVEPQALVQAQRMEQIQRFFLLVGEARHLRETLRRLDVHAVEESPFEIFKDERQSYSDGVSPAACSPCRST